MFDAALRRRIDPWLEPLAATLVRRGCSANAITVGGFLLGASGCVAIAFKQYGVALAFIALNRLADGLDGLVARRTKPTDVGGFLDIVLDFVFYSGVPFAFAVSDARWTLPAAFLIYSFIGSGGSFLAFATIATKRGVVSRPTMRRSFYYAAGLMEGGETVALFVAFCIWPENFGVMAWVFGALCWVTTLARVAMGVLTFRDDA